MADFELVSKTVLAFLNSDDLLQSRQLLEGSQAILFSSETEAYVRVLAERCEGDPALLKRLTLGWDLLMRCKADGIPLGYANFYADSYAPISDATIPTLLEHIDSEESLVQLAESRPDLLGEIRQVVVGAQLLQSLTAEMQSPAALTNPSRRVALERGALRLADRRINPWLWAAVRGELGNALLQAPADAAQLDEAIFLYRESLAFYESAGNAELLSTVLHNLGNALAARAGGPANRDVIEALGYFERALKLRPVETQPIEWVQTHCALADARLRWRGTDGEPQVELAVVHLEKVLEVCRREGAMPLWRHAARGLAEALVRRVTRDRAASLRRAIELYEEIIQANDELPSREELAIMEQRLEVAYVLLAAQAPSPPVADDEETMDLRELAKPGSAWVCARRDEKPGHRLEEYIEAGTTFSNWRELVTVEAYSGMQRIPFRGLVAEREQRIRSYLMGGKFALQVIEESDLDISYEWSVEGDFTLEDQYEVARVLRGKDALHIGHFTAKGKSITRDQERAAEWLRRLRSASLTRRLQLTAVADAEPPADAEEIDRRLQLLQQPPRPGEPAEPAAFRESMLSGVRRGTRPELYALLSSLTGLYLLRYQPQLTPEEHETAERRFRHAEIPDRSQALVSYGAIRSLAEITPDIVEVAIRAFQCAMEVFGSGSDPAIRGTNIAGLARAFLLRGRGDPDRNLALARYGYEQAVEIFDAAKKRPELASALSGLAAVHRRLAANNDPQQLDRAIQLYQTALRFQTPDGAPIEWAETMLSLGGAYEELGQAKQRPELLDAAEAAYASVLEQATSNPAFKGLDGDSVGGVAMQAIGMLQRLDRTGTPEPRTPPGFRDREKCGRVLYLRPLVSAGTLVFPNRFHDPSSFAVQFDMEPTTLTLESALYRALAEHVEFYTVGGRVEGFGASRVYCIGGEGWQEFVKGQLETASLVIMMPHDSPGVRWEVETIKAAGALGKVLFVMPPVSSGMDVRAVWESAMEMMLNLGLELPAYSEDGVFFRLGATGTVEETLPFGCLWDNRLFARIAPLLAKSKSV